METTYQHRNILYDDEEWETTRASNVFPPINEDKRVRIPPRQGTVLHDPDETCKVVHLHPGTINCATAERNVYTLGIR